MLTKQLRFFGDFLFLFSLVILTMFTMCSKNDDN